MRVLRYLLLAGCFASSLPAIAQKQAWIPVTSQDLSVKGVSGSPGAPAIQLYYSQRINDRDESNEGEYIYRRIKVLNEKGLDYANVEIQVPLEFTLSDLKARTIHSDGKTIDFSGKPFDKVVAKGKGFKFLAKTFTFSRSNGRKHSGVSL